MTLLLPLQVNPDVLTRRSKDSIVRPVVAKMLCQYSGLTQRQAAEIVGVRSGVAVCLQIRKVDERMKKDRVLQRHLAQIEALLRQREKKVDLFHKGRRRPPDVSLRPVVNQEMRRITA